MTASPRRRPPAPEPQLRPAQEQLLADAGRAAEALYANGRIALALKVRALMHAHRAAALKLAAIEMERR